MMLNALVPCKKLKKLILTIHCTILNEIWKSRNLKKHENKNITSQIMIENIEKSLKEIVQINFNKHLKRDTITTFEELFAIKNALCNVQQNTLNFNF